MFRLLNLPAGSNILVVSYIGYTTKVQLNEGIKSVLNISLENVSNSLGEVSVISLRPTNAKEVWKLVLNH
jgi:hypothetical protein